MYLFIACLFHIKSSLQYHILQLSSNIVRKRIKGLWMLLFWSKAIITNIPLKTLKITMYKTIISLLFVGYEMWVLLWGTNINYKHLKINCSGKYFDLRKTTENGGYYITNCYDSEIGKATIGWTCSQDGRENICIHILESVHLEDQGGHGRRKTWRCILEK